MIDILLHLIGVCPDHHSHGNLILLLTEWTNFNFCWCMIKMKIESLKQKLLTLKTLCYGTIRTALQN